MNPVSHTQYSGPSIPCSEEKEQQQVEGKGILVGGQAPSPNLPHRQYVLCTLPRITTFDFSGVTKADRTTAEVWKRMNIKPKKARIKQVAL